MQHVAVGAVHVIDPHETPPLFDPAPPLDPDAPLDPGPAPDPGPLLDAAALLDPDPLLVPEPPFDPLLELLSLLPSLVLPESSRTSIGLVTEKSHAAPSMTPTAPKARNLGPRSMVISRALRKSSAA